MDWSTCTSSLGDPNAFHSKSIDNSPLNTLQPAVLMINISPYAAPDWASKIGSFITEARSGSNIRMHIFGKLFACLALLVCMGNRPPKLPALSYEGTFWRIESEWIEAEGERGFRLYVSAALNTDSFSCHGCAPQLAIIGLEKEWNGWHEGALVLNLGHFGSWGKLPSYKFIRIAGEPYFLVHSGFSGGGTSETWHQFYTLNSTARQDSLNEPMLSVHTIESAEGGFGWRHLPAKVQGTIEEAGCEVSEGVLGYYQARELLEIDSETGVITCQMVDRKCGVEPPCYIEGIREEGVVWELNDSPLEYVQLPCSNQAVNLTTGIDHWPE